jgi:hypothetical protein
MHADDSPMLLMFLFFVSSCHSFICDLSRFVIKYLLALFITLLFSLLFVKNNLKILFSFFDDSQVTMYARTGTFSITP